MDIEKKVAELVEGKITEMGRPDLFIVSVKFHTNGKLVILVDGDKGVGIADCVQISRHVGFHLEEKDIIKTAYNLEVSSPGVDMPLTLLRQYAKNIGRQISVKIINGNKREGLLTAITEDAVIIEEKIKEKGEKAKIIESVIPADQITETKVILSFK
jgi:ribosome maturation factor RimP